MTITVAQLEQERKINQARNRVGEWAKNSRNAFIELEKAMRELHDLLPYEHICSFILSAPEMPPEVKP